MKYFCVKQHDITDCAAACLATVCKQYGRTVSLSRTRRTAGTDTMGTNVYGVVKAAQQMGFTANSVKGDRDAFFSEFPLPAIAHIITEDGLSHYVVIHKVAAAQILIADPAKGLRKMAPEEFFKLWTGVLVLLVPEGTFQKGKETKNIFERFWGLLLPQKRMVAGIFVSSLAITALGILAAFYFQIIMDYIVPKNDGYLLFVISVAAIFLYLVSVLLSMGRTRLFLKLSQKLDLALLLGYYNHVLELPMDFFGTRKTGEIISRFQDATSIRTAISQATLSAMIDTLMAVAGGIILYCKNPVLFLITLAIAGCYAVIVLVFNKPYREANQRQLEDNAQLTSYLVESLNGIQTVKAFNGEGQVKGETDRRFKKLLRSVFRLGEIGNLQTALKSGVQMIGGVVIIWAGASYVLAGEMTLGSLMTFNALLVYFLTPIKNLIDLQPTMQTALVASDRLGEILDLDPEKGADEGEKAAPASLKGDICFEHVSFRYGTRELVLKDFSLDIKQGERIAIVGESGAGKTTIAKLLLHFYSCEAGSLRVGGQDISGIQLGALREKISYIPQETFLFSGSILENLTFGSGGRGAGDSGAAAGGGAGVDSPESGHGAGPDREEVVRCAKMAQIHDYIESLPTGYDTRLEENGENLSGGQRQRMAIARALLKKPDILILDEATSNLDAVTETAVQETIDSFSEGMTTIIIAHRLSTIRRCDRIFVIDKGQIVESGTHSELLGLGKYYAKLYEFQVGGA